MWEAGRGKLGLCVEKNLLKKLTGVAMALAMGFAIVAMASMIETAPPRATTMATASR